jgi:hypothetical protein
MGRILTTTGLRDKSIQILDYASREIYRNVEVVYIEGGLGSQLLGTFEYLSKIELDKKSEIVANLDYFEKEIQFKNSDNTFWQWSLSRYEIDPTFFKLYSQKSKFLKLRKNRIKTWATPKHWEYIRQELPNKFKLDDLRVKGALTKYGVSSEYTVLHVRRGDYLKVASRIMGHQENIDLLKQIKLMIRGEVFIVSDETFSEDVKQLYRLITSRDVIFLDAQSEPDYVIHDLMRMSNVLITSNSTFSFTAGIMARPETVVFTPNFFYGDANYRELTLNFQMASNFTLLT